MLQNILLRSGIGDIDNFMEAVSTHPNADVSPVAVVRM